MKVLVVSSKYPPEYSGSGNRTHNTYRRLAARYGVEFDVVASSVTSNTSGGYVHDGVAVKVIANKYHKTITAKPNESIVRRGLRFVLNKLYGQRTYWQEAIPMLAYLIRNSSKFDTLHVVGNATVTSAAISYAKITKKPLVVELVNLVENPHPSEPRLFSSLFGRGFPKHARIICIAEALKDVCLAHGYPESRIWARNNPLDETRFFYEPDRRSKYRRKLSGVDEQDVLIFHLAKFIPRKNQLFMAEVMSYLPENYKLILAGPLIDSGPLLERDRAYYQSIIDTIRARNLEDRVHVIPRFVSEPEKLIKAADVVVMPSVREAYGGPVTEAIACGVPVVTNDVPGVFDSWVKPGVNGYICQLDHKEWAAKIVAATQIDDKTMKEQAQDMLKAASTEVIDGKLWALLQEAGGPRRSRRGDGRTN